MRIDSPKWPPRALDGEPPWWRRFQNPIQPPRGRAAIAPIAACAQQSSEKAPARISPDMSVHSQSRSRTIAPTASRNPVSVKQARLLTVIQDGSSAPQSPALTRNAPYGRRFARASPRPRSGISPHASGAYSGRFAPGGAPMTILTFGVRQRQHGGAIGRRRSGQPPQGPGCAAGALNRHGDRGA